jgi:hypothetical protein
MSAAAMAAAMVEAAGARMSNATTGRAVVPAIEPTDA